MKYILLSLILCISISGFSQTKDVKLASDVWPPFTNVEGENAFALELVEEALGRIDINTSVEIVKWAEAMAGIESGIYDGSAAMWLDDDRQKEFNFSNAYLQNKLILIGLKGSDVSATSFSELSGKKIGVVEDYAYGDGLTNDIQKVEGKSDQQNLERLLSGQIDYMLVDALLIQYMLKYQVNDVSEYLSIASSPIITKTLHLGLNKDIAESEEIIKKFNDEIAGMVADGSYNKILHLNWVQADLDGDGEVEMILAGDQAGTEAPQTAYGLMGSQAANDRYYIEGQTYYGWANIPDRYKSEVLNSGAANPNDAGFKLNFK